MPERWLPLKTGREDRDPGSVYWLFPPHLLLHRTHPTVSRLIWMRNYLGFSSTHTGIRGRGYEDECVMAASRRRIPQTRFVRIVRDLSPRMLQGVLLGGWRKKPGSQPVRSNRSCNMAAGLRGRTICIHVDVVFLRVVSERIQRTIEIIYHIMTG